MDVAGDPRERQGGREQLGADADLCRPLSEIKLAIRKLELSSGGSEPPEEGGLAGDRPPGARFYSPFPYEKRVDGTPNPPVFIGFRADSSPKASKSGAN